MRTIQRLIWATFGAWRPLEYRKFSGRNGEIEPGATPEASAPNERRVKSGVFLGAAGLLLAMQTLQAQQSILGTNLIVNAGAEAGAAGTDLKTPVASIPGWTTQSGKPTVLAYNETGYVQLTNRTPPNPGFQYFAAAFPSTPAVISQTIDVSSASSLIDAGNAEFVAGAYLGNIDTLSVGTQMAVAFQNAKGQTFNTVTVGPLMFPFAGGSIGMFFQQQIGLVPVGTTQITVSLTLQDGNLDAGVADNLSLVLTQAGSTPALGKNLVVNPGAELGPSAVLPAGAVYVPGWSTTQYEGSVAPYGGAGWISTQAPGPADRGTNLFCGWIDGADLYQDIDVSAAASAIDSGQVTYVVSGWLGGSSGPRDAANLTYLFFDWSGKQLLPTAQLAPGSFNGYSLIELQNTGTLPAGTRRVRIDVTFPASDSMADDIGFALSAPGAPPVLIPGGIVSAAAFGGFPAIAPGSWIEIYGDNLFSGAPQQWTLSEFTNDVAPTSVGGVTVSIGGRAAFIDYVSSGQVNALVPSNATVGPSSITLTNANGTSGSIPIYVNTTEPGVLAPANFAIGGKQYIAALFSDGQTFALPQNALPGVPSRPAQAGDVLTIYGVGFGPVSGGFTAGTVVTANNSLTTPVAVSFGSISAVITYDGLAPSFTGLYQFDVVVPNGIAANAAEPISFSLGGVKGTQTLYIAVQ